jgi:hypothetical protein
VQAAVSHNLRGARRLYWLEELVIRLRCRGCRKGGSEQNSKTELHASLLGVDQECLAVMRGNFGASTGLILEVMSVDLMSIASEMRRKKRVELK